jgi:fermentation-respiration switch protein FrsA (DUF1100 family)
MEPSAPTPEAIRIDRSAFARRIGQVAWRLARLPLMIYMGVVALFFALQTRLIFPGSATQGDPSAQLNPDLDAQLVSLTTSRGDRVVARFGPALTPDGQPLPDASDRPTILFFYGNGECLRDESPEFERFRCLGANVLIPEYVGYGLSGGKAGETGCCETAEAAFGYLLHRPDVDPSKIVVGGRSLGGAVAIDLASRRPIAALFAMNTFTSMLDMAQLSFPFLPSRWLLRHRFDSLARIGRVRGRILLIHGTQDQLVPYAMTDRLAAAARSPVTRLEVEGAGHNDLFVHGEDTILSAIGRLLEPLAPHR